MTQKQADHGPGPTGSAGVATAVGPGLGTRLRRGRAGAAVVALVVLAVLLLAWAATPTTQGALRADAATADGSLALTTLLGAQGVEVEPVTDLSAPAAGAGRTVLVTAPARLSTTQREALVASRADLVLVAPDPATLLALAPGVVPDPTALPEATAPGCPLPAAVAAGPVDLETAAFSAPPGALACYPVAERSSASLVVLDDGGRTVTVVGDPAPFTNGELDRRGNAALALGLLGGQPSLAWYAPVPPPGSAGQLRSPTELLPAGVVWGAVALLVAGVVAALWRGRRLGPLTTEVLPVVVPSGETVRGRARLYRRTGARGRAAAVLRARTRRALAGRLGLAPGAPVDVLAGAVSARTGHPAPQVHALLAGADPEDDRALVVLAADLDALARELAHA